MVTATKAAQRKQLDAKERSSIACHFEEALREKIVGQGEAVQALGRSLLFPGISCFGLNRRFLIKPFSGDELLDAAALKGKPSN